MPRTVPSRHAVARHARHASVLAILLLTACGDDGVRSDPARAASIEVSAGGNQAGEVGETLPVAPSVLVRDSAGRPLAGVLVNFTARAGQVASASARTNASGVASAGTWRLPERSGRDTVVATVSGLTPLLITARANAGAPVALSLTNPNGFQSRVFEPLDLPVFRLVDRFGNGVPGVPMTLSVLDFDGTMPKSRVLPASEPTDDFGIVGATSWIPYVVGEHRVTATVGSGAFTATATRRVREDACGARRVIGMGMTRTFELEASARVPGCPDTLDVITVVTTAAARLEVQAGPRAGTSTDPTVNMRSVWLTRAPAWSPTAQVLIAQKSPIMLDNFGTTIQPGNYDVRVSMPRSAAALGSSVTITVTPVAALLAARQR